MNTAKDGRVLHANLELGGQVKSVGQDAIEVSMRKATARLVFTGYRIVRVTPVKTRYGSYSAVELRTSNLPMSKSPMKAGAISITIDPG